MLNGIILIDKQPGTRSTECLNNIKKVLEKKQKTGHAGTLDSTAQGLLVVLLGNATRSSSYIMSLPKTYEVVLRLGQRTDTDDYSGKIIDEQKVIFPDSDHLKALLLSFIGRRMQAPPRISALRVNGTRSHKLARDGSEVEVPARPVLISSIEIKSTDRKKNTLGLKVLCHKGTYIRSLVRDLGDQLGCGAHVSYLRRTRIGPFHVNDGQCLVVGKEIPSSEDLIFSIKPLLELSLAFTRYSLSDEQERLAANGVDLSIKDLKRIGFGIVTSSKGLVLKGKGLLSFGFLKDTTGSGSLLVHPETNIITTE